MVGYLPFEVETAGVALGGIWLDLRERSPRRSLDSPSGALQEPALRSSRIPLSRVPRPEPEPEPGTSAERATEVAKTLIPYNVFGVKAGLVDPVGGLGSEPATSTASSSSLSPGLS